MAKRKPSEIVKMQLSEIVLDYELYPRGSLDAVGAGDFVEAMRAGATFPPVVVDKKSKRLVDGWHRVRAARRLGLDTIDVVLKTYANEAALYTDAVALNKLHGIRFGHYDQARILVKGEQLRIRPAVLAGALGITLKRLELLKATRMAIGPKGETVALKPALSHMPGRTLTEKQVEVNKHTGGMNPLFYVNQLRGFIEADLIDVENAGVMAGLRELCDELCKFLPAEVAAASV